MPFRFTHSRQLKFIHSLGFNYKIINPEGVYTNWLNISLDLLKLLPSKERVMFALQSRLLTINDCLIDTHI